MQQHPGEFASLLELYHARKPRRVLEIGCYEGGTLHHWLQGHPDIVVAVDDFDLTNEPVLRERWQAWTPAGTELEIVAGDSRNVAPSVERFAPFDWAFLDADHSYDAVRGDWERYRPMCTSVVAFHDILPPSDDHPEIQVSRLWQEIKADGCKTTELIDDPDASWGGIGVVFLDERTTA